MGLLFKIGQCPFSGGYMPIFKLMKAMTLFVIIALLTFMFFAGKVSASSSVLVGGLSKHIGADTYTYDGTTKDLQEHNTMLGFEQGGFSVFGMRNSYDKFSMGAGYTFRKELSTNVTAGFRVGAVTGYKHTPVGLAITPFIGPELDYRVPFLKPLHVVGGYLPSFTGYCKGILTLNFKWVIQE